jgi:hypothetical protein
MVITLIKEGVVHIEKEYFCLKVYPRDLSHLLKKKFGFSFNQRDMTTV